MCFMVIKIGKTKVNLGLGFAWKWTLEFQEKRKIDDLEIIVPKRKLLLITKMMAAMALGTKANDIEPHYRLAPKIYKDYQDAS